MLYLLAFQYRHYVRWRIDCSTTIKDSFGFGVLDKAITMTENHLYMEIPNEWHLQ
jgi:hypothetical protein